MMTLNVTKHLILFVHSVISALSFVALTSLPVHYFVIFFNFSVFAVDQCRDVTAHSQPEAAATALHEVRPMQSSKRQRLEISTDLV